MFLAKVIRDLNYFYNLFSHREADKPYLRVVKTLDYTFFMVNANIASFSFTEWVLRNCFTTSNYHFAKEN